MYRALALMTLEACFKKLPLRGDTRWVVWRWYSSRDPLVSVVYFRDVINWMLLVAFVASVGCALNVEPVPGEAQDAAPSTECIIGGYDVCGLVPGLNLTFASDTIFDTDSNGLCKLWPQEAGPDACLVYMESMTVTADGSLLLVGDRPLILVSRGDVELHGPVSVSSVTGERSGAGSNGACVAPTPSGSSSGGAAGGSFGGSAGPGGDDSNGNGGGISSPQISLPPHIRGGCSGGFAAEVFGGASGGGLSISSLTTISNQSEILANGAGGGGGHAFSGGSGGGGGGSGGMIRLVAPSVFNDGVIVAHGGGGGGGARLDDSYGTPGEDGNSAAMPAQGGPGGGDGAGDGGNGSGFDDESGWVGFDSSGAGGCGGGGGGGGAGFVVVGGNLSGDGLISPGVHPF